MRFTLFLLTFVFFSCNIGKSVRKQSQQLPAVKSSEIAYVDLTFRGDTVYTVRLGYHDQKRLSEVLNSSESAGIYKFIPTHSVNIKFRDSTERSFRIHKDLLKEKGDNTFKIQGIEKLFEEYRQVFNVKVGEKFKIHFTTNSCCPYCWSNEKLVSHVKVVSHGTAFNYGQEDCLGCAVKSYIELQAISPGIDTIFDGVIFPREICNEKLQQSPHYIVNVK